MSRNEIKDNFTELGNFLGNNRLGMLEVPEYQREFDWNESHVEDLWEDIHNYVEKSIQKKDEDYYIGTVILREPERSLDPDLEPRYQIVDGQQRITSFYLLAIALRKKFKEIGDKKNQDAVNEKLINKIERIDSKEYQIRRLHGAQSIREVLNFIADENWDGSWPKKEDLPTQIHGSTLNSINRKLKKALTSHEDEINGKGGYEEEYDPDRLWTLFQVIQNIRVMILSVETDERAFYLFETTNARGKTLEPGDLLKNHLFAKIDRNKRDTIYSRWSDVVSHSVGKLVIMLKHFYYVHDSHVQKNDLYKALKNLKDDAETLFTDIEDYAKFHYLMHKGTYEHFVEYLSDDLKIYENMQREEKIKKMYLSITALRYFKSELTYPVIYGFMKRFSYFLSNDERLDKEKNRNKRKSFKKYLPLTLEAFERFQFINYKICSNKGNKIEKPYAKFAGDLFKSSNIEDFLNSLESLYSFFRNELVEYDLFKGYFTNISLEEKKDTKLIHYIFHKIEEKRQGKTLKEPPIFNLDKNVKVFDVEHFAPETFTTHSNTEEEVQEYEKIHQQIKLEGLMGNIGNLVSMHNELNNKLKNKTPRAKWDYISENMNSNVYRTHSFLSDFDVVENEDWDVRSIQKRSEDLAKECFDDVFAIGEDSNFPKINPQILNKFKN